MLIILLLIFIVPYVIEEYNTETSYVEVVNGNTKTITMRIKDKIGSDIVKYEKIKVIKLRVDDESEFHITYIDSLNKIHSDYDIEDYNISLVDGVGSSWVSKKGITKYQIVYPLNMLEYFED